jgi:hypothetical protein
LERASSSTRPARSRSVGAAGVRAAVVAALFAGCFGALPARAVSAEDSSGELARLARETEILRQELQLANDHGFYMLLDPGSRTLRVMLEGVTLAEYAVSRAAAGEPRLRKRGKAEPWYDRIWTGGRLDPARRHDHFEVVAPPVGSDTSDAGPGIPPLPEEAFPASLRFRIRYDGGLALEVRPSRTGSELGPRAGWPGRFGAALGRFLSALSPLGRDAVRLRLTLEPEDAAALYRSLPPDTKLLVTLPPAQQ